jgi:hypothetical protein
MSGITTIETLLFNVRLSIRYHNRRREFFETFNLGANAVSVIFGSAAMATLLSDNLKMLGPWAAFIVTIVAAINLVIRSSDRARQHHDLSKRFAALEQKVFPATEEQLAILYAEKLSIEADELPPLNVLAVMCHNDQISAEGIDPDREVRLRWWQRAFAHLLDLPPRIVPPPRPGSA